MVRGLRGERQRLWSGEVDGGKKVGFDGGKNRCGFAEVEKGWKSYCGRGRTLAIEGP